MQEDKYAPSSLEGILISCFGCPKPFRNEPICVGTEPDGEKVYDQMTKSGWKAYGKLVDCIYALETMGVIDNANDIIEELDDIVSENGAYTGKY